MWGGSGGLVEYRAALLASHGFAAMALLYVFPDQNKNATIGYPYFEVCVYRLHHFHIQIMVDARPFMCVCVCVCGFVNAKMGNAPNTCTMF